MQQMDRDPPGTFHQPISKGHSIQMIQPITQTQGVQNRPHNSQVPFSKWEQFQFLYIFITMQQILSTTETALAYSHLFPKAITPFLQQTLFYELTFYMLCSLKSSLDHFSNVWCEIILVLDPLTYLNAQLYSYLYL